MVVKVGDELAFDLGPGLGSRQTRWSIHAVEKITPSGRIVCGPYELNPDLSIRGKKNRGYWGPSRGELVTKKIRDSVEVSRLISLIERVKLSELSLETLSKVWDVIKESK
jgi:hypothetical protein